MSKITKTFTKGEVLKASDLNSIVSCVNDNDTEVTQSITELQANSGGVVDSGSDKALATLCGQPPILFGAGTPQEAVVPMNWKQFDAETGEGYNWNGEPSAIGQQYINTSVSTGGRYVAVPDDNGGLTWKNF